MVVWAEFGECFCDETDVGTEVFEWRGFQRLAFFKRHPSGPELICVLLTGRPAGEKLPKR